ncbi:hypothetical protein PHMEG_00010428 [Phytophthora megakarya]|uniref:Uncharacterized protein n=1 Tax=Phytophthora megakarya TaxID=4795 RepID=A0A225WE26_9STRA|nr:hypothetical protein PHMEG_00010428 [Phytophthora megakarya]
MLTLTRKRRAPRNVKRTLSHLYYYLKHGSLSKTTAVTIPVCVEKEIDNLNEIIRYCAVVVVFIYGSFSLSRYVIVLFFFRRVCTSVSPDTAAQTASRAERTLSELDVSASRK